MLNPWPLCCVPVASTDQQPWKRTAWQISVIVLHFKYYDGPVESEGPNKYQPFAWFDNVKNTPFDPYCFELSLQIQSNIWLKGLVVATRGTRHRWHKIPVLSYPHLFNSNVKLCLQNSSFAGEGREKSNYSRIKMTENQDKVKRIILPMLFALMLIK